jgi:pimeloyl-ACP methyl ester carboxylesterase
VVIAFIVRKVVHGCWFVLASVFILHYVCTGVAYSANWEALTPLDERYSNEPIVAYDANLYVFGGTIPKDNTRANLLTSSIGLSGNVGSWLTISNGLPRATIWHSAVMYKNYVYLLGGAHETYVENLDSVNNVTRASIGNVGNIGPWVEDKALPERLGLGSAITVGNRIYYSGGGTWTGGGDPIPSAKVYMATVMPNGDIDTSIYPSGWTVAGTMTSPLMGHTMVYTKDRIVFVGGFSVPYIAKADVISARVNADGSLDDWKTLTPLTRPTHAGIVQKYGDYVIVAGGWGGGTFYKDVYYSKIDEFGNTGNWIKSPLDMPGPNCCTGSTIWNGRMYIVGGHDLGTLGGYLKSVWMASIEDILGFPLPPKPKVPIVVIPGIGASFNHIGIMSGANLANDQWGMLPFLHVYDGLMESIKDAGYVENKDLFLYTYDWRKPIWTTAGLFGEFIDNVVLPKNPDTTKVNIVGHSMGGLIGRAYFQSTNGNRVNKLITVGSPHQGSTKVYKIWEGLDFSDFSGLESLIIRGYLRVNRGEFRSIDGLRLLVPSFQDLLPTYDYLKKGTNYISISEMKWQNQFLKSLNVYNTELYSSYLKTISGNNIKTDEYYQVSQRSEIDKVFNLWEDGKPVSIGYSNAGDGTVLGNSSLMDNVSNTILDNYNHQNIISDVPGITEVLNSLELSPVVHSPIPDYLYYRKSILVLVGSPIDIVMKDNLGKFYYPENGIIAIDNPSDGKYTIDILAKEKGNYRIYFGRFDGGKESWSYISGESTPGKKIKSAVFSVNFSQTNMGKDCRGSITEIIRQMRNYYFGKRPPKSDSEMMTKGIGMMNLWMTYGKPAAGEWMNLIDSFSKRMDNPDMIHYLNDLRWEVRECYFN